MKMALLNEIVLCFYKRLKLEKMGFIIADSFIFVLFVLLIFVFTKSLDKKIILEHLIQKH